MAYNTPMQPHNPSRPFLKGEGSQRIWVVLCLAAIAFLSSCKPDNLQTGAKPAYFDIKGYFAEDIAQLKKLNLTVIKTVTHNGATETKQVKINDWGAELNLFSQSDINKPAWRESYQVDSSVNSIIYRAKTSDLKTQLIVINKLGDKVKWLMIYNSTKNILYQTSEKLSYFPDSLYIIQKYQKVRFLGANKYLIKGKLK